MVIGVTKFTLFPEEIEKMVERRKKRGRSNILPKNCVSGKKVLCRELRANGIDTGPVRLERRAKRGKGFWRSFD